MQIEQAPALALAGYALRPLRRADKNAWYDYLSLQAVYEHTSWSLSSADDLDPLFATYESTAIHSPRRLAIVRTDNEKLVGTIGFHTISDVNRSAELAYDIDPEHWGKGIGTAATCAVVRWAQAEFGFVRTQATTLLSNRRSSRVLEKSGFQHEGVLRAFRMVRGVPGDFNMYALISESA